MRPASMASGGIKPGLGASLSSLDAGRGPYPGSVAARRGIPMLGCRVLDQIPVGPSSNMGPRAGSAPWGRAGDSPRRFRRAALLETLCRQNFQIGMGFGRNFVKFAYADCQWIKSDAWYPCWGSAWGDGVDAPRRHLCAKVAVSNCHQRRRPWSRLPRSVWTSRNTCSRCMERMVPGMCCSASGSLA